MRRRRRDSTGREAPDAARRVPERPCLERWDAPRVDRMTAPAPLSARDYALRELDGKRLPGWPADTIRKSKAYAPPVDPRDFALAENITVGVVKNLLLLQHLIQHYSGRKLKSIEPLVQKVLAIGLYQLRFLTRIPA